jgi:hypothetical protein
MLYEKLTFGLCGLESVVEAYDREGVHDDSKLQVVDWFSVRLKEVLVVRYFP